MDFSTRLRDLLQSREIAQKDFAQGIGVATSTVGNYVRGQRKPDYETLKRIAVFFRVSIDFLLGAECDKANDSMENDLLLTFRALKRPQQELLLEQGKLLLKRQ